MAPRAPTAYFIFAGECRPQVMKELQDQSENGKVSIAVVGKTIGAKWAELSDEEKQKYKDLAAQKAQELKDQYEKEKQEAAEQAAANGEDADQAEGDATDKPEKNAPPPPPFGLPTSLVKKIACMDPEVDRMSADAVRAISKATTIFIEMLAENALDTAKQFKRKNFKFADIEETARIDRRLVDMGLVELFENDIVFTEVRDKVEEENKNRQANKKTTEKEKEAGKGMKPLTSFFGGAASPKQQRQQRQEQQHAAAENVEDEEEDDEEADEHEERDAMVET